MSFRDDVDKTVQVERVSIREQASIKPETFSRKGSLVAEEEDDVTITEQKGSYIAGKKGTLFFRKIGRLTTFFLHEEEANLYDKIRAFQQEEKEQNTFQEAMKMFASLPNCLPIAKLVYGCDTYDHILRFKITKDKSEKEQQAFRKEFEMSMLQQGLFLQHDRTLEEKDVYVKVIASFDRLCREAEYVKLKLPLKESTKYSTAANHEALGEAYQAARGVFRFDQLEKFAGVEPGTPKTVIEENFFSFTERILLTNSVITRIRIRNPDVSRSKTFGIFDLLNRKTYLECFPLHSGDVKNAESERGHLNELWLGKWFRKQPLNEIRQYYGEKIAFYFAWLGFYLKTLWFLAAAGLIVFIYGLTRLVRDSEELKGTGTLARIFDHELTIVYAFLVSIWSTIFLEFWKRENARLAHRWSVIAIEQDEVPRPDWVAISFRKSPITGKLEKFFPQTRKRIKLFISIVMVLICIMIVSISVGALMVFKAWSAQEYRGDRAWQGSVATGILSLLTILVLNQAYSGIAEKLTRFENHRTDSEFENSLIFKTFLFDFVNSNASLFYIGIIKQLTGGKNVFGSGYDDQCGYGSCLVDLMIQLAIILIGKQIIGQAQELLIPWLMRAKTVAAEKKKLKETMGLYRKNLEAFGYTSQNELLKMDRLPPWVSEDALNKYPGLMDEYKEMVLQFGFITLFVTAFPLGPLFALFNNITEVRGDAHKFLVEMQRPIPFRSSNIGAWERILTGISFLAVLTNATLIACTSDYFHDNVLSGHSDSMQIVIRLAFIMTWEHVVFGLKYLLAFVVPDVPEVVQEALARERYIARVTLEGYPPAEDDEEAVAMMKAHGSHRRRSFSANQV